MRQTEIYSMNNCLYSEQNYVGRIKELSPKSFSRALYLLEVKGMIRSRSVRIALMVALLANGVALAGSVKSGPQVGEKVPGPFAPLNVTGADAGKKCCQYCKNGPRPVAVVFAKQFTPAVAQLVKKIDATAVADKERGLGSSVVVCSDAAGLDQQLQGIAQQMQIQNAVLTLYKPGGPERYRLSAEADVTVLLYNHFTVKANHAFKAGELNDPAMDAILADLGKMLSDN